MSVFSTRVLKIKTKTWTKSSFGLYDYENSNVHTQTFKVTGQCNLSRFGEEMIRIDPSVLINSFHVENDNGRQIQGEGFSSSLASICETSAGISIKPKNHNMEDLEEAFWEIVEKGNNIQGHKVEVGDIIRLGRATLKINNINITENNGDQNQSENQSKTLNESIIMSIKEHIMERESLEGKRNKSGENSVTGNICKICLLDESEEGDQLISPCDCTGSMRFVHLGCLQNWLKSKLNFDQNPNIVTIFWNSLSCELCKQLLPLNITLKGGKEICLLPFKERIGDSYVVLESFSRDKESTGLHFIGLSKNEEFKIGRGQGSNLKLPDMTVSRTHAFFTAYKGKLYIKDNSSKFGTLIMQRKALTMNDQHDETNWIQCGKTLFKFILKKPWTTYLPCCGTLIGKPKEQRTRRISLKGKSHYESTGVNMDKNKEDVNVKKSQGSDSN